MFERCLIVDDHEMIRDTIAIMATSLGFSEAITASDGADAISKLYHLRPSLIVTDLQMEPIDGLEMLRLIRSGRYGLPHEIPIIILTANASEHVIAECIAFDVDAFLVKPVNRKALQDRIDQLAKQAKAKKSVEYYFQMYSDDPAKSNSFQVNGTVAFTQEDMEQFDSLRASDHKSKDGASLSELAEAQQQEQQAPLHDDSKAFIRWQDRFSVGHEGLNDSNKLLLDIINETYDIIVNHEGNADFEAIAERFQNYVNNHILMEEDILEECEYPRLKVHNQIHQRLSKQAQFVLLKCQADPSFYKTDFFRFLRYWWVKHVVQEDTKYKEFLESATSNTDL